MHRIFLYCVIDSAQVFVGDSVAFRLIGPALSFNDDVVIRFIFLADVLQA